MGGAKSRMTNSGEHRTTKGIFEPQKWNIQRRAQNSGHICIMKLPNP